MSLLLKISFIHLVCFFALQKCVAQTDSSLNTEWSMIGAQYNSGVLNDTAYFNRVEILANRSFKDSSLKEKLILFKKIAWSKPEYDLSRWRYYIYLYNNALFMYRAGASIYYMEKAEEERKKVQPYVNSLLGSVAYIFNYGRGTSGYAKCFEEYKRVLPFLKELPQRIVNRGINLSKQKEIISLITPFY